MALLLFVTACAASTSSEAAPTPSETRPQPTQTRPQPAQALPKNILVGRKYSHVLYTHCGIRETRFAGQYWVTTPELHDGAHNPPPGWDNPVQRGTFRLLSPTEAEFRDHAGHVVRFTLRKGATGFLRLCA